MERCDTSLKAKETDEEAYMVKGVMIAFAAFILPGLGHYLQGKVRRGAIATASVVMLLLTGAWLGGRLHGLFELHEGFLTVVFSLCNLGLGGLYLILEGLDVLTADRSVLSTSEYGNVFLMLAGLINYLLVLDAFDINTGRKP